MRLSASASAILAAVTALFYRYILIYMFMFYEYTVLYLQPVLRSCVSLARETDI